MKRFLWIIIFSLISFPILAQIKRPILVDYNQIMTGDQQTKAYFPLLKGKNVALVINQSSVIGNTNLVDTLLDSGIKVIKIFSPEHGFRGDIGAGDMVTSGKDVKTGIPIISLYGKHTKPSESDLKDVNVVVFDLQDVGVRFYTYTSTLALVMEACAENHIPLILLDRPNPNGFYVDGPILEKKYKSFVGMFPVPVVYGMTIGEYALMLNGEHWLKDSAHCDLQVIPLKNYTHNLIVKLPIKPSPNLPDWEAVYLYPSLCFFEGTVISVGRGTSLPYQIFGHPDLQGKFKFTPKSTPGASLHPKLESKLCRGTNLTWYAKMYYKQPMQIHLDWLLKSYKRLSELHKPFFNSYFNYLAGNEILQQQIKQGLSSRQIRQSWQKNLNEFKKIRSRYLLYP
ncbi:MAG: DUF1343 domain-containing protein [Bacteroidales bacterium]|nr:DUF1343 domain-containing protein [Bacteroidales bacterium]